MPIALRYPFATSLSWLHEHLSQRLVRTHKVIVRSPPLQMGQEVWGMLGSGPGAACQS